MKSNAWRRLALVTRPVAGNDTAEGRALNRRVEHVQFTNSAEAKRLLKAMSDYQASQTAISFDYDAALEVVTSDSQKLALSKPGSVALEPALTRSASDARGRLRGGRNSFRWQDPDIVGKESKTSTPQVEIPGTIEHVINELKDKYHRPLPRSGSSNVEFLR